MSDYGLTKQAEADLFDIFLYGYEHFRAQQAEAYAAGLERAFQLLAANPLMGRQAEAIAPRVRRHGAHVVLYEKARDEKARGGVLILAVIHAGSVRQLRITK